MFFIQFLAILLSSAISLALLYFKVQVQNLQQLIAVVFLVLMILLIRFVFAKSQIKITKNIQIGLLFLTSLLVQLLVISSGSFYGPFLILFHIYTLALAFLLSVTLSISFLIFSVAILIGQIFLDEKIHLLFRYDPSTAILYGISFLIIVPIGLYLAKAYTIKNSLYTILSEYLHLGRLREESILSGLNELVVISDKDLKILSVSEAVNKSLNLSLAEVLGQPLLKIIQLKDSSGNFLSNEKLYLEGVLQDKTTRIIKDLYFYSSSANQAIPTVMQIKPIIDSKGVVNQLIFILSDARAYEDSDQHHTSLRQTLVRHQMVLTDIKKAIASAKLPDFEKRIEVLDHIEGDLLTALELEDHALKENISFEDAAYIIQQALAKKREFAKILGVSLQFGLPEAEKIEEEAFLSLKKTALAGEVMGVSAFSVPVDAKWLQLIIQKLIDVAILVSSGRETSIVQLGINRDYSNDNINIIVSFVNANLTNEQLPNLFNKYYPSLENISRLSLGSGLEGFIAKSVANRLNIPLEAQIVNNKLVFIMRLSKKPKTVS